MKEKFISLEDLANQMVEMFNLKKQGFISQPEFEGARFLIEMLSGDRFKEVCDRASEMLNR